MRTQNKTVQPAGFNFCFDRELNTGPSDLQSDALPTELSKHVFYLTR